ncbi:hypothetical protein [Poriferisphaera corsica]|nr:hypothetical protein [Poriferisphaera corsica]
MMRLFTVLVLAFGLGFVGWRELYANEKVGRWEINAYSVDR